MFYLILAFQIDKCYHLYMCADLKIIDTMLINI
jgi:hypothetical protein